MSELNHKYSEKEEKLNVISHALGLVLSIIVFPFLILKCFYFEGFWKPASIIIYGLSLLILYTASTVYHSAKAPKLRRRLMPISTDSQLNISDEITFDNQVVGKVLIDGKYPFALFKLFDPNFNEFSNANLKAGQADIKILIPSQLNI